MRALSSLLIANLRNGLSKSASFSSVTSRKPPSFVAQPSHLMSTRYNFFSTSSLADLDNQVIVTRGAAEQLLLAKQDSEEELYLRLEVKGGGCSGFQYKLTLDSAELAEGDQVFERDGAKVVVDEVSFDFVRGATVDYVDDLIKSGFSVVNNPNVETGCGCGTSFSLKD